VAHQDQLSSPVEDRLDGRERLRNAAVIGDAALFVERDVEIDPHQHRFSPHLDVGNGPLGHELLLLEVLETTVTLPRKRAGRKVRRADRKALQAAFTRAK
jgi:hypothetical protein